MGPQHWYLYFYTGSLITLKYITRRNTWMHLSSRVEKWSTCGLTLERKMLSEHFEEETGMKVKHSSS